jgi:hypothetical protein
MRLLIPFAGLPVGATVEGAEVAFVLPALPELSALLARLEPVGRDEGDEWSLSPPHERALARALGWQGGDGRLPWAARAARADGIDPGDRAIGLLTPVHWHLGTHQVSLIDPSTLMLSEADSRALFDAVHELFTSEGHALHFGAADRWYVLHESLAGLATASLDRVIGRNVDRWLDGGPAARRIRRLQSEVQMLLYTHPVNAAREARGLLPVNSFWLSGCGIAQAEVATSLQVDDRLRRPALAADPAAWAKAWESLDAGPIAALLAAARRGDAVELTLGGERASATFASRPQGRRQGWLQGLRAHWARPDPRPLLEGL